MLWSSVSRRRWGSIGRGGAIQWLAGAAVSVLALAWIGFLVSRPVYIRVEEFAPSIRPLRAEALSGVRGQTFAAPTERLSRIDFWVDTNVHPGSWIRLDVQLAADPAGGDALASSKVVFDRTRAGWPVQARFIPGLIPADATGYLRLVSSTNTPRDHVFYLYSRRDVYPRGEFLDLDRVEVGGQDLLFTLYRSARFPKPLAWAELLLARVSAAASIASVESPPLLAAVLAAALVGGAAALAGVAYLVVRMIPVTLARITPPAVALALLAGALFVLAWDETPVGKVVLYLAAPG